MTDDLTPEINSLAAAYMEEAAPPRNAGQATIKVSHAASILAFFYEKIRNALEYKDEHLLRRSAIERILHRRFGENVNPLKISQPLLRELIRARYLKNETVPESKIIQVAGIIAKYQRLVGEVKVLQANSVFRQLTGWLLMVLAGEIELCLASDARREALVEVMYRFMHKNLQEKGQVGEEEKRLQLYIAVHRALLKSDDPLLRFRLFGFYHPEWPALRLSLPEDGELKEDTWTGEDLTLVKKTAEALSVLRERIEEELRRPAGFRLLYFLRKHTAPFLILRDIVEEAPLSAGERFRDAARLEETVRRLCRKRYEETRARVRRMVVRAIIYIFLTKMLLGLILELPADLFVFRKVAPYPLLINALFPPFLMFLIASTIHVPGEENTRLILLKIRAILFGEPYHQAGDRSLTFSWQPAARGRFLKLAFYLFYLLAFILTFGFIVLGLRFVQFNPVSIIIFLFFLCVVALFGYSIRRQALELSTVGRGENLISPLFDFFFLPILQAGHWLSSEVARLNFLGFLFDFIIEAPLKSFIEVAEEWLNFVREKKEELA